MLNPQTRGPEDDAAIIDLVTRMSIEVDRPGFTAHDRIGNSSTYSGSRIGTRA
jgi:hypothetical protein